MLFHHLGPSAFYESKHTVPKQLTMINETLKDKEHDKKAYEYSKESLLFFKCISCL